MSNQESDGTSGPERRRAKRRSSGPSRKSVPGRRGGASNRAGDTTFRKKTPPPPDDAPAIHNLDPVPSPRLRWALFSVLTLSPLATSASPINVIPAGIMAAIFAGTWRTSRINGEVLETRMTVAFRPLKLRRWKLNRIDYIETDVETTGGGASLLVWIVLGPLGWIQTHVFGFLFPWAGGSYKLFLRMASDRRVRAWQGARLKHFEQNLELLTRITGKRVERFSGFLTESESIFS